MHAGRSTERPVLSEAELDAQYMMHARGFPACNARRGRCCACRQEHGAAGAVGGGAGCSVRGACNRGFSLHAMQGPPIALHAGRSTERPVLSEAELERNVQGIRGILQRLLSGANGAGPAPAILNNLVRVCAVRMLSSCHKLTGYLRASPPCTGEACGTLCRWCFVGPNKVHDHSSAGLRCWTWVQAR